MKSKGPSGFWNRLLCRCRAYGVLKESEGVCFRATVIISNTGKIRQITVNDFPVGRSVEETMRLLKVSF